MPTPRTGSWLPRVGRGNLAVAIAALGSAGILLLPDAMPRAATLPLVVAAIGGLATTMLLAARPRKPGDQPERRVVGRLAAVLLFVAVIAPPHRAPDLWRDAMYGRMATVHDASPYTHRPSEFASDPYFSHVDAAGQIELSRSGPAYTGLSAGVVEAADGSPLATRLAYQVFAALAIGLALLLIDRRTADPVAVALVGCNPAVLVYAVNSTPSEALVAIGLLGAVLLAERRRHLLGGTVLGAAILVKIVAGLALIPLAGWTWRHHGRRPAAAVALPALALVAGGYALAGGRAALSPLFAAPAAGNASWSSIWRPVQAQLVESGPGDLTAKLGVAALVLVAVLAVLLVSSKLRHASPGVVCAGLLVAYLVGAPHVAVGALVPALVLLAAHWRERTTAIVLAFMAVVLVAAEHAVRDPVIDGIDRFLGQATTGLHVAALVAIALLAWDAGTTLAPTVGPHLRWGSVAGGLRGRGRYFPLRGGWTRLRGRRVRGG